MSAQGGGVAVASPYLGSIFPVVVMHRRWQTVSVRGKGVESDWLAPARLHHGPKRVVARAQVAAQSIDAMASLIAYASLSRSDLSRAPSSGLMVQPSPA